MTTKFLSIKEIVEPIVGGYWGETVDPGAGNARVVRNGDVLESGEIGQKVPERKLTEKEITKSKLQSGDVLITMSGNVGRVARVKVSQFRDGNPYVASNFVKILRTKGDVLPEYLFFVLRSEQFKDALKKHTRGVAIQNLSVKIFEHKFIPDIPLNEQKQIVALLEEAELIKHKQQEVEHKINEVIPALLYKTFSEQEWPKEKIGTLAPNKGAIRTGPFGSQLHHAEFENKGIPVLAIDNVVTNTFRWTQPRYLPESKYAKFKKFRVYPGDVLVTIMGTVGRVCVAPDDLPECMSTKHLCVITVNKEKINPIYLWASLLHDNNIRKQTRHVSKGAIMEGWNSTIIKDLFISVPPIKAQNEFAERVKEILALKEKQKKSVVSINELSSSLMSRSFAQKQ